jgi:hypothetical protein
MAGFDDLVPQQASGFDALIPKKAAAAGSTGFDDLIPRQPAIASNGQKSLDGLVPQAKRFLSSAAASLPSLRQVGEFAKDIFQPVLDAPKRGAEAYQRGQEYSRAQPGIGGKLLGQAGAVAGGVLPFITGPLEAGGRAFEATGGGMGVEGAPPQPRDAMKRAEVPLVDKTPGNSGLVAQADRQPKVASFDDLIPKATAAEPSAITKTPTDISSAGKPVAGAAGFDDLIPKQVDAQKIKGDFPDNAKPQKTDRGGYDLTPEQAAHFDRYANTDAKRKNAFYRFDKADNEAKVSGALKEFGISEDESGQHLGAAGRILASGKETDPMAAYERAVMEFDRQEEHLKDIGVDDAKDAFQVFSPRSGGAAATPTHPTATIKAGRGVWGASTEGRNVILQQAGKFNREHAKQDIALEKFRRASNSMTPDQTLDLIRYTQGRSKGATLKNPQFKEMADEARRVYSDNAFEIGKTDETAQMEFERDHFKQLWMDPRGAQKAFTDFVGGKEGTSGFTKKKKYPTWDDGLAAGLTPKSMNYIDILANDTANQNKFISLARTRDVMGDQGYLKWVQSGEDIPADWIQLTGWGAKKGMGWNAYAPPGMARNYNNFVGRGWADVPNIGPVAGSIARGLRATTAAATSFELGLSGYHVLAITKEAFHTTFADAVYEAAHGRLGSAVKEIAKAPVAAPYYLLKGMRAAREYLGSNQGSATLTKAVDALAEANAHMAKIDPAFLSGTGGSLWQTFKRGAFQKEFENSARLISESPSILGKMGTTAKEVGGALGDVLNTISQPLFQFIIPNIKRGMMTEGLSKWIDANPAASWDEILDHASELSNIADERFGEMMQDNLFWNSVLKQTAQIGMRSASWAYGSWTQYAGGVKELKNAPKSGLSRRSSYVLAGLIAEPLVGAIVTYAMTGDRPKELKDFMFPPTGGTVPEHPYGKPGATYTVPERLQLPGNIKEVIDIMGAGDDAIHGDISGFRNYASGKLNDFWSSMGDLTTNTQWPGDTPLYNPALPASAAQQYFKWAWNRFGPISIKSAQQKIPRGSHLGAAMRFAGPKVPGRRWLDPKGFEESRAAMNKQKASITKGREKKSLEDSLPRNEDSQ